MLTFKKDTHEYFLDGRRIPSVTEVLKSCGVINDAYYTLEGAERGRRVHEAAYHIDLKDLNPEEIADDILGYTIAYSTFIKMIGERLIIIYSEEPRASQEFLYAGTPDRVVQLDEDLCIIDLKTGKLEPWHKLQLAAYGGLFDGTIKRFFYLGLQANGKPDFREIKMDFPKEFNSFLACLSVHNWKTQNLKKGV